MKIFQRKRQRGFSIIEISVGLFIAAILTGGVITLLDYVDKTSTLNVSADDYSPDQQLAIADTALMGWILTYHRLPCPADPKKNSLREEVTEIKDGTKVVATACKLAVGYFPAETLSLKFPEKLRYGVYRSVVDSLPLSLASTQPVFTPFVFRNDSTRSEMQGQTLIPAATGLTPWPWHATIPERESWNDLMAEYGGALDFNSLPIESMDDIVKNYSKVDIGMIETLSGLNLATSRPTLQDMKESRARINGLDFCAGLQKFIHQKNLPTNEFGVNPEQPFAVAYALAHPGTQQGGSSESAFETTNSSVLFELPNNEIKNPDNGSVLAVSFAELSTRLQCPRYLTRADGAAATAMAAYDNYRYALAFLQYKAFQLDVSYVNFQNKRGNAFLIASNVINQILLNEVRQALRLYTSGLWSDGYQIIYEAEAQEQMVRAALQTRVSEHGVNNAIVDLHKAKLAMIAAQDYAEQMRQIADESITRLIAIDTKGLQP